jgi:Flp pilus assembly protein TadG
MKPKAHKSPNKSAKAINPMTGTWLRMRRSVRDLSGDNSGIAAVEFAMIVPLMLVLFFGTVEFSSGLAIDRKVTVMARTLSDLTSQNVSVTTAQLTNFRNAGAGIMTPYDAVPVKSTITELYVDPATKIARVQWSVGDAARGAGSTVAIPAALQVGGTYLIYSEVSYKYVPVVGYVMAKAGINLSDFTYTRPRQSSCVMYNTAVCTTT